MLGIELYLYDSEQEENGYRGQDFSKYISQGSSNIEDITQEIDRGEMTLYGYTDQAEFLPETKFIIDIIENGEIVETLHRVVQKDLVSQPQLADSQYYDHHISFSEPSVIAQKRLVDNISATYKLKDVTLEEQVSYDLSQNATMANQSSVYTPSNQFRHTYRDVTTVVNNKYRYDYYRWGKYFEYEGIIEMQTVGGVSTGKTYRDIEDFDIGGNVYQAKFSLPKLAIYAGVRNTTTFTKIGYASIDYLIEEFPLNDNYNPTNSWSGSVISNSNLYNSEDNVYRPNNSSYEQTYRSEWLDESHENSYYTYKIRKYTDTNAVTPVYETQTITIQKDKQYKITISLHEFSDNVPTGSASNKHIGSPNLYIEFVTRTDNTYVPALDPTYYFQSLNTTSATSDQTQMTTQFITYDVDTATLVLSSSVPYSAMSLLQKAVMNSFVYEKKADVYIGDINNNDVPFYVDPNFIDELKNTKIIENFYNQKNLWEILLEVGNYIHAVPEIVFGEDDRLKITFNKLGRTDQNTNQSTRVSIMNSRSMEDYVSACSSYITNMVQLGGSIEEWVAPKTTSENYLVSNDTAEIIVSKPIIELLEIRVKCNTNDYTSMNINQDDIADMTPFIYEENVYKTLSLQFNVNPNKGIAMYYALGDNRITGGNYQLPQANPNAYTDYNFKKIIYCAFNGYPNWSVIPATFDWKDIKIKDFSFFVKYRTKDSVRQNHTRPDLRKYLLNSKYDKVPQHNQFNNQTDVVIDSVKFGNNMYGKLIRTGNSNYITTEWNDSYSKIKHKGELYNIGGELYYVAKVEHTFYSTYIISDIEYSKDYNQLSPIIGIPSEPRFYEISEQSLIRREVAIDDYLLITDNYNDSTEEDVNNIDTNSGYLAKATHLKNLIFTDGTTFSKYVVTTYKGDKDVDTYEQNAGIPNFYIDILTPINAYSSENTLTYEWDTIDNFSAGDKVVSVDDGNATSVDVQAYKSLKAVQYTDIYGKVALFDFYILGDITTPLTDSEIQALPESPYTTRQDELGKISIWDTTNVEILASNVKEQDTNYNGRGLGLLKDCREALSINYNLQAITTSDTFVISPFFYLPNKDNVKIVFLCNEVNKLTNGYIDKSEIIDVKDANDVSLGQYFNLQFNNIGDKAFQIDLSNFSSINDEHFEESEDYQRIKAIAIICNVSLDMGSSTSQAAIIPNKTQFILARNIPSQWSKSRALKNWSFGHPSADIFKNKQ